MMVEVPALRENTITYTDTTGEHTITGISFYVAWVESLADGFDFVEDYNARYTVLAG